ncbi:MAG TPA: type II toxin-antitoxin system RelE/ParE family toxin [Terriglobales bacterium]|nr:type II toxin-antitoxin system RelE/ParE family toxin [Terriglobales bacterium]
MKGKLALFRALAQEDVEAVVDGYRERGEITAGRSFVRNLERAIHHLQVFPASGSPRYGRELDLPGLRAWQIVGSRYLIFYLDRPDCIDIWRVLHASRDIPAWLEDSSRG